MTTDKLQASNLSKWHRIIPDYDLSDLIEQCFQDALQSFFSDKETTQLMTRQENDQQQLNNVSCYLISVLKGLSGPVITLSLKETLVVVTLINQLEKMVISLEQEIQDDREKMSQSYWSLVRQTKVDNSHVDYINQLHYKTEVTSRDSEGNVIIDGNELCSALVQELNPFRTFTDIYILKTDFNATEEFFA